MPLPAFLDFDLNAARAAGAARRRRASNPVEAATVREADAPVTDALPAPSQPEPRQPSSGLKDAVRVFSEQFIAPRVVENSSTTQDEPMMEATNPAAATRPRTVTPQALGAQPPADTRREWQKLMPQMVGDSSAPPSVGYDPNDQRTRPRVASPRDFTTKRVQDDALEPKPTDHNGRLKSTLIGLGRGALDGFIHGGLGGAIGGAAVGGISHAADPSLDERHAQNQNFADDRADAARVLGAEDARSKTRLGAANADYAELVKPTVARGGLDVKRKAYEHKVAYDSWRMKSGDRKQDTAENYIEWRMKNGDRRATTAEGQLELRREWVEVIQPAQFDRRQTETETHNDATEGQGQQRIDETIRHDGVVENKVGAGGAVADVYESDAQRAEGEADAAAQRYGENSPRAAAARSKAQTARTRANVARARAGGAYAGKRIRRANLSAAREALHAASDADAERILRSQGAIIID